MVKQINNMRHLRKFESYSSKDEFFRKYFSERDYKELNTAISQIESHSNVVAARKGNDPLVNLCLRSDVFVFYKDFYGRLGERVTKFPVPREIYEFETIIENIDRYIDSDTEQYSIFKSMLEQTKTLLVYFSYFPFVRNELRKRFDPEKEIHELFGEVNLDKKRLLERKLFATDGLIRTALFVVGNYNPIFEIHRYNDRVKDIDYVESSVLPNYEKLHNKLKNEEFEEQLYSFSSFVGRYKSYLEKAYREIFNVDDFHDTTILNKFSSMWAESKHKERQTFEFTGDFREDYRRYTEAYDKNR